jgi:hypothetical protein
LLITQLLDAVRQRLGDGHDCPPCWSSTDTTAYQLS